MAAPFLIQKIPYLCPGHDGRQREVCYKAFIFIFTFLCYMTNHINRSPISAVKSVLYHKNCSEIQHDNNTDTSDPYWCDWPPFNKENAGELLGVIDMSHLSAHALAFFLTGYIADRVNIRYFLTFGMVGNGLFMIIFGLGYFYNIHSFLFYLSMNFILGGLHSTGYPCLMTCMGNWFGKNRRGLIMALWHTNTNIGNILGFFIAGIFVEEAWGWSFVVPGLIIIGTGIIVLLIFVPNPDDVNCTKQEHSDEITSTEHTPVLQETASLQPNTVKCDDTEQGSPLSFPQALAIPGVLDFAFCKLFVNLVWYSLFYWLPKYITVKINLSPENAAYTTPMLDIGGLLGGILSGFIYDKLKKPGLTIVSFLITAAPLLFIYDTYGSEVPYFINCFLLMVCGASIYGPYTVIGSAIIIDLGTHKSLRNNDKAVGIVTAIIIGTGTIGAMIGTGMTGWLSGKDWQNVFYMFIIADCLAAVSLTRMVYKDIYQITHGYGGEVAKDTVLKPVTIDEDLTTTNDD